VQSVVTSAGFRFLALALAGIQSGALTLPLIDEQEHHDRRRNHRQHD
jgi:hypothetical protein